MNPPLLFALLAAPMGVQAAVAPASLDGLELRFVLQDGRLIDTQGQSRAIPEGTNISFTFDADNPGISYKYTRVLPATGVVEGTWWNGGGRWTLYFSSSCEGSATFTGTVDGKPVHYEDVYFVIGANPTPMGVNPGPPHRSIAIHGGQPCVEFVMHPTPGQLEIMQQSPYLETDMVFGYNYAPERSAPDMETPMVAVRYPGEKRLTWGGWRNRALGTTQPVCHPGAAKLSRSGVKTYIHLAPDYALEFAFYELSMADGKASFCFVAKDGEEIKVEDIPFTIQTAPKAAYRGLQFQKTEGRPFGFDTPVRACFLDSTVAAVLRPTGKKPAEYEFAVLADPDGALEWKAVQSQTVTLPCGLDSIALDRDAKAGVYKLVDIATGKQVAPAATVKEADFCQSPPTGVPAPKSLKGKRVIIYTNGDEDPQGRFVTKTVAFPDDAKGELEDAVRGVTHALYLPGGEGSSTASLEFVNDIPNAIEPARRYVLHFKDATSGTARGIIWKHAPHRPLPDCFFLLEPLE